MTAIGSALVIGSGIAGPVTAMALQKAGIDRDDLRGLRRDGRRSRRQLTVAPNGLDALGSSVRTQPSAQSGQPINHTVMADGNGRLIGSSPALPTWNPVRRCGDRTCTGRCTTPLPRRDHHRVRQTACRR